MIVFLAYCFLAFGAQDFVAIMYGESIRRTRPGEILSAGEIAILIAVTCFIIGYATIANLSSDKSKGLLTQEWSPRAMIAIGILLWIIGFFMTALLQFGASDNYSKTTISSSYGGFVSLLRMLHLLGPLILIYLFLTTRNKKALLLLLLTISADAILGFVGDSKEIAMRTPILYIFSILLLRERLPILQIVVFILAASVLFNLFAAYRGELQARYESRGEALQNLDSRIGSITRNNLSLEERFSEGLEYMIRRISIKPFVEIAVERTGNGVDFQNGATITPLLYAFIPRFILPNKPDAMTGQLFNREFRISEDRDTYIACSQIGELYWNYGWTGLIIGMLIIGSLVGAIGSALRLDTNTTLPRFLFLLLTAYLLALRFETSIASTYTVWARAAVLFFLLHTLMPKAKGQAKKSQ